MSRWLTHGLTWLSAVALPWFGYYLLAALDLARLVHREMPVLELERRLLGGASAPERLAAMMALPPLNLAMVVIYLSFYPVLLGLPAWLLWHRRGEVFTSLRRRWAMTAVVGYPLYFLVPTRSPYYRLELYDGPDFTLSQTLAQGALEHGFAFPYDALPSLHVAFALIAVVVVAPLAAPGARALMWTWLALLHLATLATGSHYLLDLLAGDALAGAVWTLAAKGEG